MGEQRILGGERVVQGALADAGHGRHFTHRGAHIATTHEQRLGRLADAGSGAEHRQCRTDAGAPQGRRGAGDLVPGQTGGTALARLLFGDVNPSGKLSVTVPASNAQGRARNTASYPGDGTHVYYDEGPLVGYRWYDATGQRPRYPVGYGLSTPRSD